MATNVLNINDSISKAVGDIPAPADGSLGTDSNVSTQTKTEAKTDATTETTAPSGNTETPTTEETTEDANQLDALGLSPVEQQQAIQLFAAMRNPEQQKLIVDALAKQAGYTKIETKQDLAEAKDEVLESLKESLGPDLAFMADKLAPALNKILDQKLEATINAKTADIRQNIQQQNADKVKQEAMNTFDALGKNWFDKGVIPDNVMAKMNEIMNEMPPTGTMTTQRYLTKCFNEAMGELNIAKKPVAQQRQETARIDKNRNNAPARLANERTGGEASSKPVPKTMSLDEAIQAAADAAEDLLK